MSIRAIVQGLRAGWRFRAALVALLLIALFGTRREISAAPTIYYVATTGNDGNPGTTSLPFRTVNKGVSVLAPGDTLYIRSGTYVETLIDAIPSGTSTALVTVAAFPGDIVTLRPSGGSQVLYFQDKRYITIDHLIIDAVNVANDGIKITGPPASDHIRIIDSEIKNAARDIGNGILLSQGAHHNEFIRLKIHDVAPTSESMHGIYISTDDNLVEYCEVYNNGGYGIHVYNSGGGPDRNVVRYNVVHHNGIPRGQYGIILSSGADNIAYGNVVYQNGGGVRASYEPGLLRTKFYNNTIYNNTGEGITIGSESSGAIVRNNIVYLNGSGIGNSGVGSTINTNLVTNPSFVNAAAGDFRLAAGSPAIDAGVTLSEVTSDPSGVSRPQGAAYDIGAHEFVGAGPPARPAPRNLRQTN